MAASIERLCHRLATAAVRPSRQIKPLTRAIDTRLPQRTSIAQKEFRQCRAFHHNTRYLTANSSHASLDPLSFDDLLEDAVDEDFDVAELSSTGYAELEQHQEVRELMRLAAWEMPLLGRLAKPFVPPKTDKRPLRWRYTTYFGDPHPASRKVVVEFRVHDLKLEPKAALKLKKLAGVRYNSGTKSVRMSSDSFDTQARNKRFLATAIENLIREANDTTTDSFEDIALDRRHSKPKPQYNFPHSWKMTEERRAQLETKRLREAAYSARRIEQHPDTDGLRLIAAEHEQRSQTVEEPVMVAKGRGSRRIA